ncbi:MAG TPA: tripartite tricarboxylate transporter substrate binding protein [Xanthobacteraceae bacterium]|nr:tripartite tricarboxylate transporter substrate binding protein [Xanthobacteraceae bacterium]
MTTRIPPLRRRAFLRLAAGAATLPALARAAAAPDFPTRTVRIVCGFVAGQIPDVAARLFAQALSARLGQQFIVDNRPGAATNLATEMVARADPDGYTLLVLTSSNATNATLYTTLKFDLIRDFAPVATTFRSSLVLEINPAVPAKTTPEFIAYAKANPGKINFASPGVGTLPHVAGELFKGMTGVDIVHVPYRNAYLPDLLAGQVQAAFSPISTSLDFIAQGKLRALGVTSAQRADVLRDVPAIAEVLPGYAAYIWDAIAAPKDTPADVVATLNREINAVLADPAIRGRLTALGAEPLVMSPQQSAAFVADETAKWGKVIHDAGIKAE